MKIFKDFLFKYYQTRYKSDQSYYDLLKYSGYSYQRPLKKDKRQDKHQVKRFEKNIKKLKEHQDSVILVADEARLEHNITTKPVWSKRGERPIILSKPIKQSRSFYGALNVREGQEIVHHSQRQNQQETIRFLEKIRKLYQKMKIFLIWDNAPWSKGKEIRKYLKRIKPKNLELFNFPPYSPELNPQEQVWKRARQEVSHNHFQEDFQISINNFQTFLETTTFKTNFLKKYMASSK